MTSPLDFYTHQVEDLRSAANEALARYRLVWTKLIVLGLVAVAVFYVSLSAKTLPYWTLVLLIPIAAAFGKESKRALDERRRCSRLRDYYEMGIARLTRNWDALEDGAAYLDQKHFYSSDLDLFGSGSMFQLLCSARTQAGRDTLADWMKAPAAREEALARQAAIDELRKRRDLREAVALAGETVLSDVRRETFEAWLSAAPLPFPTWGPRFAAALVVCVLSVLLLFLTHILVRPNSDWILATVLSSEAAFGWYFSSRVKAVAEAVRVPSNELSIVRQLFAIIEGQNFTSPKLAALVEELRSGGTSASRETAALLRMVDLLDWQRNEWFTILGYFLLFGTQLSMRVDRWRTVHGPSMRRWLRVLGEWEALISLATYAFENPTDPFPELVGEGPVFDAEGIAHPLLNAAQAVRNDVRLDDAVRFLIISGSNMSGKSTFLRAIGINTVLAWMGAPVRCVKLRLSRLEVGAAVRVQDSVVDGRSHFLSEMQRLRQMIESAKEGPLLFLADEILSGTNSHDRRITAEWVVRALVSRGALGAITTHDLALTEIANGMPGSNVHFTDAGGAGTLDFDFKLRPGLLSRSNALHIARMLGIEGMV